MPFARTEPLRREIERTFPERPFRIEFWDGTSVPSTNGGPTFRVRSPKAIANLLRAPGQLGIGRAYVRGELLPDDLDEAMTVVAKWRPPPIDRKTQARLLLAAARGSGLTLPPRAPIAELSPRGKLHSKARDARAVRHHYDVSNEFFALFLDDSMTYSCAIFSRGAETLEAAQEEKLDLVCRKLELAEGDRVLDVGSGWGSFGIHAAKRYGARVLGITLSEPQATLARHRAAAAGVSDKVEFRVMDYRDLAGERFDKIASIGMVEHVGRERIDLYAQRLAELLRPGGRLLNHGISRLAHNLPPPGDFSNRYVFPDGETLHLSRVQLALERAGFETEHVEGFREDYAETLRHWIERLDRNLPRAEQIAGGERLRVWRLYLRAARNGFTSRRISVYQVKCLLPDSAPQPDRRQPEAEATRDRTPSMATN
jgi:cyclopropane-fatty-acyl-phospholipid synthase